MLNSDVINSIPSSERSSNQLIRDCLKLIYPVFTGHQLIRLGAASDGGYLIPNCLSKVTACFSPGVFFQTDFEDDLARIFGIPCHLCDPAHDQPAKFHHLHTFDRISIAYDGQPSSKTLSEWVSEYSPQSGDLILSMDIEGAEYPVFANEPPQFLARFNIITFELHSLYQLHSESFVRDVFIPMFQNLLDLFDIIHVHPNNKTYYANATGIGALTDCLELTLLRKDYRLHEPTPAEIPHKLDSDNVDDSPSAPYPSTSIGQDSTTMTIEHR